MEFDQKSFAAAVKHRIDVIQSVDDMGLRAMAEEIGVSASTLSRVSNGKPPTIDHFAKICGWLGESPAKFFLGNGEAEWLEFMEVESS